MNDPKEQPIDIEDQRKWLIEHKASTNMSWKQIAQSLGLPTGTISQFGGPNGYAGNELPLAEAVFRYRQTLTSQAAMKGEAPPIPGYFQTETSAKLIYLLKWAQRGRMVVAALGPGLGKSITAEYFQACNANVFKMTVSPSTAGVFNMQHEALIALGDLSASGTSQTLSRRIKSRVRDLASPLLIVDEAQHLTEKAVEEIRSWHDATGLGIALFGNESVQQRLEGGNRSAAFAQIFSRVSLKLVRSFPLSADIDAMLDAWNIHDASVADLIRKIAKLPGGLRGATFALELAHMIAASERQELTFQHVLAAWEQLSARAVAA